MQVRICDVCKAVVGGDVVAYHGKIWAPYKWSANQTIDTSDDFDICESCYKRMKKLADKIYRQTLLCECGGQADPTKESSNGCQSCRDAEEKEKGGCQSCGDDEDKTKTVNITITDEDEKKQQNDDEDQA